MSSAEEPELYISFIEKTDPWHLMSHLFPSKIGGRPAWLALENLPRNVSCEECQCPLTFLMQIYAPLAESTFGFHRTIFIFFCKNNSCYEKGKKPTFKAFRSQLQKANKYFSHEPPNYNASLEGIKKSLKKDLKTVFDFSSVCATCGCYGNFKCSRCGKESYCSRDHQLVDWKDRHKILCKKYRSEEIEHEPALNFTFNKCILPEFGLSEPEVEETTPDSDDDDEDGEEDDAQEVDDTIKEFQQSSALPDKEYENYAKTETPETKQFQTFQKRISSNPMQVLRYQRRGQPLWVSATNQLSNPPKCELCGGERVFEFQIMPQLLNHLNLDVKDDTSPDWGSLYVYTCASSCDIRNSQNSCEYASEFVFKQDVVE